MPEDGVISEMELVVNFEYQPFRIGIYRPIPGATCQFKLIQQKEWRTLDWGYHKVISQNNHFTQ